MKCEFCGREIPKDESGFLDRRRKYCSDECAKSARRNYMRDYHNEKYGVDEQYTESHKKHSAEWSKQNRQNKKVEMYNDLINGLAALDTRGEMIDFLKQEFHITRKLQ